MGQPNLQSEGRQVEASLIRQAQHLGCFPPIHLSRAIGEGAWAPSLGEDYVISLLCVLALLPDVAGVSKWPSLHREHEGPVGMGSPSWWQAWRPDRLSRRLWRWRTKMQVIDVNSDLTPEPWWIDHLTGNWGLGSYWAKRSHSIWGGHLTPRKTAPWQVGIPLGASSRKAG